MIELKPSKWGTTPANIVLYSDVIQRSINRLIEFTDNELPSDHKGLYNTIGKLLEMHQGVQCRYHVILDVAEKVKTSDEAMLLVETLKSINEKNFPSS